MTNACNQCVFIAIFILNIHERLFNINTMILKNASNVGISMQIHFFAIMLGIETIHLNFECFMMPPVTEESYRQ